VTDTFCCLLFFASQSSFKPVQIRRRPHAVANTRQNAPLIELVREVRVAARDLSDALPTLFPFATRLDIPDDVLGQPLDEHGCGSKRLEIARCSFSSSTAAFAPSSIRSRSVAPLQRPFGGAAGVSMPAVCDGMRETTGGPLHWSRMLMLMLMGAKNTVLCRDGEPSPCEDVTLACDDAPSRDGLRRRGRRPGTSVVPGAP